MESVRTTNTTWSSDAGAIRHFRAAWITPPKAIAMEGEIAQGYVELETFDKRIRGFSVRVVHMNGEQLMLAQIMPLNSAYWVVARWNDEREYNKEGEQIYRTTRELLFDLPFILEKRDIDV